MFARWHGDDEMRAVMQDFPGRKVWHLKLGPHETDERLEAVAIPASEVKSVASDKINSKKASSH
jgi:hypothetical protein